MTQLTKREQSLVNGYLVRVLELEEAIIQALLCLQQDPKLVVTAYKLLNDAVPDKRDDGHLNQGQGDE